MNQYEISKLKKQLQRKQQLLRQQQQDRQNIQKQLSQTRAQRDTYFTQLEIARQKIANIDKIIQENVKSMKQKILRENSDSLNQLKIYKQKLYEEQTINQKLLDQNRNKQATIAELSARLKELSKKYKDTSLLVNTKQISQQAMLTHNQFYKLTEKYNKLSQDMQNIMAENKILRKLHGVPDNFGFDLQQIKIAQKQQLQDYKAQCRKLQTEIQQLEAQRTQLRYRLRQYNTLYSNKGQRYKGLTQKQFQYLDQYALKLKQGKIEQPQIDKSKKQMEKQILKLRAQVQVLQNKTPMSIITQRNTGNNNKNNNQDKLVNDQLKKIQQQIKTLLQPFVQDIKKLSQTNINSLIQNFQNIQNINGQYPLSSQQVSPFKGPLPLPIANNDWSRINQGYSFIYSSKIPVDMKQLQSDINFNTIKARYQVAALQLQNIQSLKLLKQKQKIQIQLSKQLLDLKDKYKKCLKVQDQLFIRYFKLNESVGEKMKKFQIEKYNISQDYDELRAKYTVLEASYTSLRTKEQVEERLKQYTTRLALRQAEIMKLQRKYQIISDEQKFLRDNYTNLQKKTKQTQITLKQKLTQAKNNQIQLASLVNIILDDVKESVSSQVHSTVVSRLQLMNDRVSKLINKQTQLRLKIQKLQSVQRDTNIKDQAIENLRDENLQILLQLQIIRNRLKNIDTDYALSFDTFQRLIKHVNENNISLISYFKKFDRDGTGELDKNQFENALKALGFKINKEESQLLFSEFDLDGSCKITYKQFIRKMRRGGALSRSQEEMGVIKLFKAIKHSKLSIRQAFQIIDIDGSNSITKSQMQTALSKIGIQTTAKTVQYIFKMCDYDNSSSINCNQLQRFYKDIIKQTQVLQMQNFNQEMDWKMTFVIKLEEISNKLNLPLKETFKKLDQDNSQVWTINQLTEFVKKANLSIERVDLLELFDFLDRRRDGKIEYSEFLIILAQAKAEQKRIKRINQIKQRVKKMNEQNQKQQIMLKSKISLSQGTAQSTLKKLNIRLQAYQMKQKHLLEKIQKQTKGLANTQQQNTQLKRTLQTLQNQKSTLYQKYFKQKQQQLRLADIRKQLKQNTNNQLKKQINLLKVRNIQMITNVQLYKGLYEGITDKNKGEQLRVGKIQAQRNKYYDIVKQLQSTSDLNGQLGKLHIQLEYSKRNQQIINSKYENIINDLRTIQKQNQKIHQLSQQKQKQIINAHLFFRKKSSSLQEQIAKLSGMIIPTITMDKMEQFINKLRQITHSKSSLEQENKILREKNFNLQIHNDYVQNQKIHLKQLEKTLKRNHPDELSKSIIQLTKKLSDYKMSQLKSKRELNLSKQKEEYYMRVNNTHTDNIKQLEQQLSNWQIKFNQRQQFWRKRLSDQMKLMQEFQNQANKAKQQQINAMKYFQQRKQQSIQIQRKYQTLNQDNHNNISQFININKPTHDQYRNDQYTQQLLTRISSLQQQLQNKQKQLYQIKSTLKQIVPEHKFNNDFGSQMNISTNSFVLQTQLTSSQLKNNARRFLNNQKEVENFYKEENSRITQAARQSIDTLQKIIDQKNQQIRKKQKQIQELKKQFIESKEEDCKEIQKLNQQLRQLRSKNSMNQIMSKTTKNNFYPSSKSQNKLQEYQKLVHLKDQEIKNLQDKYDKLVISKSSANNQKTAAKNAQNNMKLQQRLDELNFQRQNEKKNYQQKQKKLQLKIAQLNKINNVKSQKIEQLNKALMDIKNDIMNQKMTLTKSETEENLEMLIDKMKQGTSKNDAQIQQYLQKAMMQIKQLQSQNHDLKEQLKSKESVANKTSSKWNKPK